MLAPLVLATLLTNTTTTADIGFVGNTVLTDDVYRSVIDLARTDPAPADEAQFVEDLLQKFLLDSGYDLAAVRAQKVGKGIVVEIDEGRLDKILFIGLGAFRTIELQIGLRLPGKVFNRPLLERMLVELREGTDVTGFHYVVVPVEEVEHAGIQIEEPRLMQGIRLLQPGRPHELRIFIERARATGLSFGLGFGLPEGLSVKANYNVRDSIFEDDETSAETQVAVRLNNDEESSIPFALSEVGARASWYTPPILSSVVRPFLWLEANVLNREREDIDLIAYFYAPLAASLNLELALIEGFTVSIGGGIEQRHLLSTNSADETEHPAVTAAPKNDRRLFAAGTIAIVFNPEEVRRDRRTNVLLEGRFFGDDDDRSSMQEIHFAYHQVLLIGWDELQLGAQGVLIHGDVPFYSEVSISDGFLRATFDELYTQKAGALLLEYRISLSRDILKLSLFNDIALYEKLASDRTSLGVRLADNVGVGLHVLIADSFQLDLYVGIGLAGSDQVDAGIAAKLKQAF